VTGAHPGKITACSPPFVPATPEILMLPNLWQSYQNH
jgi:hypothetical protein